MTLTQSNTAVWLAYIVTVFTILHITCHAMLQSLFFLLFGYEKQGPQVLHLLKCGTSRGIDSPERDIGSMKWSKVAWITLIKTDALKKWSSSWFVFHSNMKTIEDMKKKNWTAYNLR